MGSSGSGRISDYPGTSGKQEDKSKGSGGSGGGSEDRCARAFNVTLEDVEHSEFFEAAKSPPPVDQRLSVQQRKRLVAVTDDGQTVGNLPTPYNYLASCLKEGWRYEGLIKLSVSSVLGWEVNVDFAALPPE